ncbi:apolipoprotein D [Hyalella azteca]|uniref:Apolipoprotein D n=1 Tax=Hyalella azteca TaxID=294128 RepID=A0A8B7PAS1_HYAAZ|nr:apolipoprotein D [Hyalella azteca]
MIVCVSFVVFAALMNLSSVEAGFGFGGCPNQGVVDPFVQLTLTGTWYEFGKYAGLDQLVSICTAIKYTPASNGLINVEEEGITLFMKASRKGQMKRADPSQTEGKYSISFWTDAYKGRENDITAANYNVLAIDPTSYVIIWNCFDALLFHIVNLRVITKDRVPSQSVIDEIYNELSDRQISTFGFARTSQQNC